MKTDLKERIAVARGLKKADLVLKGGTVLNIASGESNRADVAVYGGTIAGLGDYDGRRTMDVSGKLLLPGFIDSHIHIESSMLIPAEYARAAVGHGTTAVIADPHEISNVLGLRGIRWMLRATEGLPLDVFFMLPSCVPASTLETSGAKLTADNLAPFMKHPRVLGLAEMMDYPGVLQGKTEVLRKLDRFRDAIVDGHAPGLRGKDLAAYAGAGISSDHETLTDEEAREKVRLGMTVYLREGSSARNIDDLFPAITPDNAQFFCLCTDDLEPDDLLRGSINTRISKLISFGINPVAAVRMATLNPARHFGLRRKGMLAPGYDADIVVVDSAQDLTGPMVFKAGRLVAREGSCIALIPRHRLDETTGSVRMKSLAERDIELIARSDTARVIQLIPDQIETKQSLMPVARRNGIVVADTEKDVLKIVVAERHRASGRIGIGLVKGFGLKTGAIASTVAHDSHNTIAVGVHDRDIIAALSAIRTMDGGLVVVRNSRVLASLPLPVAGLMSGRPAAVVVRKLVQVDRAVRDLGSPLEHPFGALSFLALPVIPELKITDRGLVDVGRHSLTELFA